MKSLPRLVMICALATTTFVAPIVHAACSIVDAGEIVRLRTELGRLARKNATSGAIAQFRSMLRLGAKGCEIRPDDYQIAGNAARASGAIGQAIEWLDRAGPNSGPDVQDLRTRFGMAAIREKPGALTRVDGMPFAPDERAAVEAAITACRERGKYTGFLPVGTYNYEAKSFEVRSGSAVKL